MNREEQILAAAKQQYVRKGYTRDAFIAGAQWADKHPKSPWISVEDRLPKPELYNYSENVLLLCKGEIVYYAFYDYDRKIWLRCFEWVSIFGLPTHWMPIPELPEVE